LSRNSSKLHIMVALIIVLIVTVLIVWAAFAPLAKGVICSGTVVVDNKRKTVQHLEGGIVHELFVKEGSIVKQGQTLLVLDDTKAKSDRDTLRFRYLVETAKYDTYTSLLLGKKELVFGQDISKVTDPQIKNIAGIHQILFRNMLSEHIGKKEILTQRIGQLNEKINALQAIKHATEKQIDNMDSELVRVELLLKKKLIESSVMFEKQQMLNQFHGELEKTIANISEAQISRDEAKLSLLQVDKEWQQDLISKIAESQEKITEMSTQLQSLEDILDRTSIRAPISGKVIGLKIHTIGGVLSPGTAIMDIVPYDEKKIIEAKLRPLDVDSVKAGMATSVKFTSFKSRTTPVIQGVVEDISPDVFSDQNSGEQYYLMHISVPVNEMARMDDYDIVPGMPVEISVNAGSRTFLNYIMDPLTSVLRRSLQEE